MARGLPVLTRWVLRTSPNLLTLLDSGIVDETKGTVSYYVKVNVHESEFRVVVPKGIEVYRAFGVGGKRIFFTADGNDNNFAYATEFGGEDVARDIEHRKPIDLLNLPWYDQKESAKIFEGLQQSKKTHDILRKLSSAYKPHPFKR